MTTWGNQKDVHNVFTCILINLSNVKGGANRKSPSEDDDGDGFCFTILSTSLIVSLLLSWVTSIEWVATLFDNSVASHKDAVLANVADAKGLVLNDWG